MLRSRFVMVFALVLLTGCISSSTMYLRQGYSMNAFEYASELVPDRETVEDHMISMKVEQGLTGLGFKVISISEWASLPSRELSKALAYRITAYDDFAANAYVTLEFYDRDQEKLFTFTGKLNAGGYMTSAGRLSSATDAALAKVGECYSGYKPAAQSAEADKWATWPKVTRSKEELTGYFDANLGSLDPIEGIWTSTANNQYQLAIFRDSGNSDRDFVATIMKSEEDGWSEYQVKSEFQRTAYSGVYTMSYYMRDHSKQGTTARVLSGGGKLSFVLRNPLNGNPDTTVYIKNYPANATSVSQEEETPQAPGEVTTGSGFLLTETGLVATCSHVVEHSHAIEVTFPAANRSYSATIVVKDKGNDLAVLKLAQFVYPDVSKRPIPYVVASSSTVKPGQDVFTLGFPLGEMLGTSAKLSSGTVSSLYGVQDDPRMLQISNPVQPGNSGGPLFDIEGRLVGVVVASLNARYFYEMADIIPQNVNFAVKSDYLSNLVSMLPEDDEVRQRANRLAGESMVKQVELVGPCVVNIKSR